MCVVCVCIYIWYVIGTYLVHVALVRDGTAERSRVYAGLFLYLYTPIYLSIYLCVCVYDK